MTTVAFDGKKLAIDRRFTSGIVCFQKDKFLPDGKGGFFFFVGDYAKAVEVISFIQQDKRPPSRLFKKEDVTVLHLSSDGRLIEYETPYATVVDYPCAWGSGTHCALVAMHLGKDAKDAVETAALFDPFTSSIVDEFQVQP